MGITKPIRRLIGLSLALALTVPVAASAESGDLGAVRGATAKYHQVERAIADGYVLGYKGIINTCIAHPTDGAAMGYHYFNADLIEDGSVDPLQPEGLVYESLPNGKLKLVAVEWIVPGPRPPDPTLTPPTVLGEDMHVLNQTLGWYIHHAWVWKHNPSGVYSDWNPEVSCP